MPTIRVFQFMAILLTALGLTMGAAHVLELGPRMKYDDALYMEVTRTLYLIFGIAGAAIQLGSIACVAMLCWMLRRGPAGRWMLAALVALVASLGLWALIVAPVNAQWGTALSRNPASAIEVYARLRWRWEAGHVVAFVAWLIGFACLVWGALPRNERIWRMEMPPGRE